MDYRAILKSRNFRLFFVVHPVIFHRKIFCIEISSSYLESAIFQLSKMSLGVSLTTILAEILTIKSGKSGQNWKITFFPGEAENKFKKIFFSTKPLFSMYYIVVSGGGTPNFLEWAALGGGAPLPSWYTGFVKYCNQVLCRYDIRSNDICTTRHLSTAYFSNKS